MDRQTPGDLLICSLEDLGGYEFKKFRNKLSDFSYGNKLPIPRGKLENADCITTKDLLIDTYGAEQALDVTIQVLTLNGLVGPSNTLQERKAQIANLKKIVTSDRLAEWRKKYVESMKKDFQRVREHNARRGETVCLQKIYTKLQLIKGPQFKDEKMHEMLNSGSKPLNTMKTKSDKNIPTTIPTLFDPDEDDFIPKIVVLQGPAGIGKTMTSKKMMLDWASGDLYQDKFDFVFHLSCRELNNITGSINLVGLLSKTSKLQRSDNLQSILKDSESHDKLLFIVDGFDELRWTLKDESKVDCDPHEETNKEILLQRLLRKQVLKESSLIITTRPLALEKLETFVEEWRHVEILGFTEEDRKQYFHNVFKNIGDADKALSIIKENEILNTLCTVPVVCWIVCTVMKPQIKQDLDLLQHQTATSIYLLYLKGLIKYHSRGQPVQTCLKKLCALAKEGVLNQKILFEMEDLNRHELTLSEVESAFLDENLFRQDIDFQTCYSFIHLTVQEFLGALYYVLDDGSGNLGTTGDQKGTTGVTEGTSIPEICKGHSLSALCKEHPHLTLAVRFLFGLLNEKEVTSFSKSTGINISLPTRRVMIKWLIGERLLKDSGKHTAEEISCLYETQDKDVIKRIFSSYSSLEVEGIQRSFSLVVENCSKQLYYCLKTCEQLHSLSFTNIILNPKYLKILSPLLHRCQTLRFQDLNILSGDSPEENRRLTFTQYDEQPDGEEELPPSSAHEVPADLSWLTHPESNIRTLQIQCCGLTQSCCYDLRSLLITTQSLTTLDISWNSLKDSGIKLICEGLKHPGCTLQDLSISECDLTPSGCDDLRSVLIENRSLTTLDISSNSLKDSGIKLICKGLKHPGCTLQDLSVYECQATLSCCDDLCSAISANRSLRLLETSFHVEVKVSESDKCFKGLKRLGCTVKISTPSRVGKAGRQKERWKVKITYRRRAVQK